MENNQKKPLVPKKYLVTFILITTLFALWGFANDITNPLVDSFKTLMEISTAKASLIQFAFYGGYATMAIPAALFIRKYSYKKGVLVGLILYAIGAFLFIPAASYQEFSFFCISYAIITFGLSFLETAANPFILSLGDKETSTRRLNLAQSFNPIGSLTGMAVSAFIMLPQLISAKFQENSNNKLFEIEGYYSEMEKSEIRLHDFDIIRNPYVVIGIVVLIVFIVIAFAKIPQTKTEEQQKKGIKNTSRQTLKNLWNNKIYRKGVIAQFFYVGAQITTWTFIIQYAGNLKIVSSDAQKLNMIAMAIFIVGRFTSTLLMKNVNSRKLLAYFSIGAIICSAGAICIVGIPGLCCLIGISFFMSLMFPTIYGIALEGVDSKDTTLGAAFLVMAILGGALITPLQGLIIDQNTGISLTHKTILNHPSINVSYIIPLLCFIVTMAYGFYANKMLRNKS